MIKGTMIDLLYGLDAFRRQLGYAQQLGMNMIRFPLLEMSLNPHLPIATYKQHMNQFLDTLEVLLPEIAAHGLQVIIDMHHPVGGMLNGRWRLFRSGDEVYQTAFINYWIEIGRRFDSNPTVAAYELLNEPGDRRSGKWNKLHARTRTAMLAAGIHKACIVGHDHDDPYNMRYLKPNPIWVIYSFHLYHPKSITHQGASYSYGRRYGESARYIESKISYALRFRDRYQVPLFCSEFGCSHSSGYPSRMNQVLWLQDVFQIFKKHAIGWIYNYTGDIPGDIWSPLLPWNRTSPQVPDINNPAAQLLKNYV